MIFLFFLCNKVGDSCVISMYQQLSPMDYFTSEEFKPSEKTLNIIRQIAYTYRVIKMNGKDECYCLN